jgi:reprolysin-like metallo-peptidase family M12B
MSFTASSRFLSLLLLALLGCSGDPGGPSTGTLSVRIIGLPSGSSASVALSGPDGFSQTISSTQDISGLAPGTYTLTASEVTVGAAAYTAAPPTQTVSVFRGDTPASASITYSTTTGNLAVLINGLPSSSNAAVTVTGPNSYNQTVIRSDTLIGLTAGSYTVTAQDVTAAGGTAYSASPPTQNATVSSQTVASATVTYTPPPNNGTVNLRIDGMYLTQSAQNYGGSVPLVQNRDGYLRVFVVANRSNNAAPAVRVRFYNNLLLQDSVTILPAGLSTPTAVDESSLNYTWNVPVSGALIQPGLRIQAVVDPTDVIVEDSELDNTYPSVGPLSLSVRTVPALNVTFIPILQKGIPVGRRVAGNVTDANKASFLTTTQQMHPIPAYNAAVHAAYTTSTTDTLQDLNGNNAWGTLLGEIEALRVAESSQRYYYGVAKVSYTSGVAGIAYVSTPQMPANAAMGWDYLPTGAIVAAHELGHNWGRNHAPCGGPSGIDQAYPQPDGSTGGYGLDVSTGALKPPSYSDIMGYCDPKWISDYTYSAVLNYLNPIGPFVQRSPVSQAVQPSLLVWGHIRNGELVLEPAFQVNTRPKLPSSAGPYSVEARADDGSSLFSLSFTPAEIADGQGSQQNFAFAIPLSAARAARLASLHLSGQGRQAVMSAGKVGPGISPSVGRVAQPDSIEVRRTPGGKVALRWDAVSHPMVMVRDPDTDEVLSFARGGNAELTTFKGQVDLVLSDGVKSRVKRMPVAP